MKYIVPLDSRGKSFWHMIMIIATICFSVMLSYRLTFKTDYPDLLYWIFISIFCLDIFLNFLFSVKINLKLLNDHKSIAANYLRGWFFIDLLAAIPFSGVMHLIFPEHNQTGILLYITVVIRILPLFKMVKIFRLLSEVQVTFGITPGLTRLVNFAYIFVQAVHYMGLGWIIIGASEATRPPFDQYIRAVYWCLTTVATIGYGDYHPNHDVNLQIIYTMGVMIFGVGMYGYIIGNVSTLIANLDVAKATYVRKMEEVDGYMRNKSIPRNLQDNVKSYYLYLWETRKTVATTSFLDELPHTILTDILLFLNKGIIEKVGLFKNSNDIFVREIVQLLKPLVFLPDDFIIRQGEYGDCMYFLNTGKVEVIINGKTVDTMGAGSPFGETALIQGEKRTASIKAISHCDVYRLSKNDFDNLRAKYPEFDEQIKKMVEEYVARDQGK